jgi:hypothetical protein
VNPPPSSWKERQLPNLSGPETILIKGCLAVCAEAVPVVAYRPSRSARHERMLANPTFIERNRRICFSLSVNGEIGIPEPLLSTFVYRPTHIRKQGSINVQPNLTVWTGHVLDKSALYGNFHHIKHDSASNLVSGQVAL